MPRSNAKAHVMNAQQVRSLAERLEIGIMCLDG